MVKRRPRGRRAAAPPAETDGRAMGLGKKASAVVGFVSAVVGLLFLFFPQLTPGHSSGPSKVAAEFGRVQLDPSTTQGSFLERTDRSKLGFTQSELARRGAMAAFTISVTGYRH